MWLNLSTMVIQIFWYKRELEEKIGESRGKARD
jgi:hypothetical protein